MKRKRRDYSYLVEYIILAVVAMAVALLLNMFFFGVLI
jgi:hypothetical protein